MLGNLQRKYVSLNLPFSVSASLNQGNYFYHIKIQAYTDYNAFIALCRATVLPLLHTLGNNLRNPEKVKFPPRGGLLGSARVVHRVADFGPNINYDTNLSEKAVKLS